MAKKEYKVVKKRNLFNKFLKGLIRIFKTKPSIVNLNNEPLIDKAIYVSNHSGASGPMTYEMFFPKRMTPWGAHEMCGNYKSRWNYLYHVFYRQKMHWGKAKAFIIATLFAIISKLLYNSVGLIGTYQDTRLLKTMRDSTKVLDENMPLLIFPEDSTLGYLEPPESFNKGYLTMSKLYYKLRKVDLPIYPMYYSKKKALFVVGEPIYYNKLIEEGFNEDQINNQVLDAVTRLYFEHVQVCSDVKQIEETK